jgi:hypothetical protein
MSPTPAPTPTPIPAAPATGTLTPLAWADPQRKVLFEAWLADLQGAHQLVAASLRLASADASFRRYLRIDSMAVATRHHGRAARQGRLQALCADGGS